MKKIIMKGFTLIEILGVVILIGILALIIFPFAEKSLQSGKDTAINQIQENIILAAKKWASDHSNELPDDNNSITVGLDILQEKGYIDNDIKNPVTGELLSDICIRILGVQKSKKMTYEYEYIDKCSEYTLLFIKGTVNGEEILSGEWVNSDITLTAVTNLSGSYKWYKTGVEITGAINNIYTTSTNNNTESKEVYKVSLEGSKRANYATYVAAIDKVAPTVTTSTIISETNNLTISLNETSNGSGLAGYAVTTTTTKPTSWIKISGTSYSKKLTQTGGTYYVFVKDNAGNISMSAPVTVVVDTTPPVCTWLSGPTGTMSNGYVKNGTTLTYELVCIDSSSFKAKNIPPAAIETSNSSVATVTSVSEARAITNGYQWTVTATAGATTGTANFRLKASVVSDTAGNKNELSAYSSDFKTDNTGPTCGTKSWSPSGWATSVTFTQSCTDTLSGCKQATYQVTHYSNYNGSITIYDNLNNSTSCAYTVTNIETAGSPWINSWPWSYWGGTCSYYYEWGYSFRPQNFTSGVNTGTLWMKYAPYTGYHYYNGDCTGPLYGTGRWWSAYEWDFGRAYGPVDAYGCTNIGQCAYRKQD